MNFADILDRWEKQSPENMLYDEQTKSKDSSSIDLEALRKEKTKRRVRLLRKKPDATVDLHGLNSEEAWITLDSFFYDSREKGLEKVLIIHGKGNHSGSALSNPGVLRDLSRRFIESCPFAGESGNSSAKDGGSGATWVILK